MQVTVLSPPSRLILLVLILWVRTQATTAGRQSSIMGLAHQQVGCIPVHYLGASEWSQKMSFLFTF